MPASFLSRKLPGLLTAACALAATLPGIAASAETAVLIPPPAQDAPAGVAQENRAGRRLLLGRAGRVPARQGRQLGRLRLRGRTGVHRQLRHGERRRSGHAEAVEITYDPAQVSYGQLLQIYFSVAHDPTQLNRQGPDTGTQYRSAVFPASDGQRQVAEAYIAQLNRAGVYGKPMATTIEPLKAFYRAEDYHQDYLVRHPYSMYIMVNDVPKVENLAKVFPARYQDKPVLVYP